MKTGNGSGPRHDVRGAALGLVMVLASLGLVFLVGEGAFRVLYLFKDSTFEWDDDLGWRTVGNLDLTYTVGDGHGGFSEAHLETDTLGFRMAGQAASRRPKILVLGDSFTFAREVSQDETYYARLATELDAELFVYACEGYGTLQEYMVLERYIDDIEPDLLVWQFCWNDFIGNAVELERQSAYNNNGMRRPYLSADGEVRYATPKAFGGLRSFAQRRSRLIYSVLYRVDLLLGLSASETTVEDRIESSGGEMRAYSRSVATTKTLLAMARERAVQMPMLAFDVETRLPYSEDFARICAEVGIEVAGDVGGAVAAAAARGEVVKAQDGAHWNAAGHRICAETLLPVLRERLSMLRRSDERAEESAAGLGGVK